MARNLEFRGETPVEKAHGTDKHRHGQKPLTTDPKLSSRGPTRVHTSHRSQTHPNQPGLIVRNLVLVVLVVLRCLLPYSGWLRSGNSPPNPVEGTLLITSTQAGQKQIREPPVRFKLPQQWAWMKHCFP